MDTLHKTWNHFLHGLCFSTAFSWDLAKHVFPETSAQTHLVWEPTTSWVWSREGPDEVGRFARRYAVTMGLLFTENVTPGPTSL